MTDSSNPRSRNRGHIRASMRPGALHAVDGIDRVPRWQRTDGIVLGTNLSRTAQPESSNTRLELANATFECDAISKTGNEVTHQSVCSDPTRPRSPIRNHRHDQVNWEGENEDTPKAPPNEGQSILLLRLEQFEKTGIRR